jgi:hypothetical protein
MRLQYELKPIFLKNRNIAFPPRKLVEFLQEVFILNRIFIADNIDHKYIGFKKKNANYFAENSDHNIHPWQP